MSGTQKGAPPQDIGLVIDFSGIHHSHSRSDGYRAK